MKTGYNWELGPFEMFDAAGVRATTEKMRAAGAPIAANVEKLLAYADKHGEANPTWYKDDATVPSGRLFFDPVTGTYKPVVTAEGVTSLAVIKKAHGVVKKNPGASVIDLGDGVAAIELHSKMNALGDDIVHLITQTLKPPARSSTTSKPSSSPATPPTSPSAPTSCNSSSPSRKRSGTRSRWPSAPSRT